jgi:hypothetical protein
VGPVLPFLRAGFFTEGPPPGDSSPWMGCDSGVALGEPSPTRLLRLVDMAGDDMPMVAKARI